MRLPRNSSCSYFAKVAYIIDVNFYRFPVSTGVYVTAKMHLPSAYADRSEADLIVQVAFGNQAKAICTACYLVGQSDHSLRYIVLLPNIHVCSFVVILDYMTILISCGCCLWIEQFIASL